MNGCPVCGNTECPECEGSGVQVVIADDDHPIVGFCQLCDGTGYTKEETNG